MSEYTRAIYFKNGEAKTITEQEYNAVIKMLEGGLKWIKIQGALISADTVARVDVHSATPYMKKTDEADLERKLLIDGKFDLVEERRKLIKNKTMEHAIERDRNFVKKVEAGDQEALRAYYNLPDKEVKQISGTDNLGDYYIDQNIGEKMYS